MSISQEGERFCHGGLPRTIEGARQRYKATYMRKHKCSVHEAKRLWDLADAKIMILRKKAPKFYEERLPTVINQAASCLNTYDTMTRHGQIQFNKSHSELIKVLDELRRSQPSGECDFEKEKARLRERESLQKEHLRLHNLVSKLEAKDICFDEIGEDDPESAYGQFYEELDKAKEDLRKVSIMLAKMWGERIEEEIIFELKFNNRSSLRMLNQQQLSQIETKINELYQNSKNKRKLLSSVDHSTVEALIKSLNLDPDRFKAHDLKDLIKDTIDAYICFFREIDNKRREAYHDSLVNNYILRPKEGTILKDETDLPADVLERMDMNGRESRRQLDEVFDKFTAEQEANPEPERGMGDAVDDEGEDSPDYTLTAVDDYCDRNDYIFKRIKEEPRDDFEANSSDDEEDEEDLAQNETDDIDDCIRSYKKFKRPDKPAQTNGNGIIHHEMLPSTSTAEPTLSIEGPLEDDYSNYQVLAQAQAEPAAEGPNCSTSMELGVVAPGDKYEVIEID